MPAAKQPATNANLLQRLYKILGNVGGNVFVDEMHARFFQDRHESVSRDDRAASSKILKVAKNARLGRRLGHCRWHCAYIVQDGTA